VSPRYTLLTTTYSELWVVWEVLPTLT